jgi:hypothetical protein
MQSIFRPAARRETLGEQSEGGRRDGGLKMLCIMIQSPRGAGDDEIVTLRIICPELFAPFLPYPRASSHNAMLAREDMPNSGQNFTLCDALVASERRLDP